MFICFSKAFKSINSNKYRLTKVVPCMCLSHGYMYDDTVFSKKGDVFFKQSNTLLIKNAYVFFNMKP